MQTLCTSKDTIKEMKTQATNHISDEILITRIYKKILQLNKTTQFLKNRQDLNRDFTKENKDD